MLNGKLIIIHLIVELIKKTLFEMSQYFPKPFSVDINVNVNLSNYLTKTDLKNINLSYFIGKGHFEEDASQKYLVFYSMLEYFMLNSKWITKWISKGLSNENLEFVFTSNNI